MYDGVLAGLRQVEKGQRDRQALIVLSDGGDNASRASFEQVLDRAHASNTVIYTIALVDPLMREQNPKLLRRLAAATGGLAFEPHDVRRVGEALTQIARDMRSSYTLAYIPPAGAPSEIWRRVEVRAHASDGRRLNVRTRSGYRTTSGVTREVSGS
jgi:VWFA-related protein